MTHNRHICYTMAPMTLIGRQASMERFWSFDSR